MKINYGRLQYCLEPFTDKHHRKEIMGICIYDLSQCDELHLLSDWKDGSIGATLEFEFAVRVHMPVIYHEVN